ncbi:hypothetical protein E2C01_059661 [Portunus trituberculatus]|uniref:Uncharacterized protein n=1 Tax=Portunus trituberculatus TaxID=210409 RepID=A0A5B7H9N4_PORTR|nr:hypothetical protein [Portunus trituberculatus]
MSAVERGDGALIVDSLSPPCKEVGKSRYQVGRETQTDGLIDDNSVIYKTKGFSEVHKSNIPTDNQLSSRMPHPQSISNTNDGLNEHLCCGSTWGLVGDAEDNGGCIARMVGLCHSHPTGPPLWLGRPQGGRCEGLKVDWQNPTTPIPLCPVLRG